MEAWWEESKCSWKAYAISCNGSAVTSRSFRAPSDELVLVCRVIRKSQWGMTGRGLDFKIPSFTPAADAAEIVKNAYWYMLESPRVRMDPVRCVARMCERPAYVRSRHTYLQIARRLFVIKRSLRSFSRLRPPACTWPNSILNYYVRGTICITCFKKVQ
jgi:hypothetical protein